MKKTLAFTDLSDSPESYLGESGKFVAVKATEDGVEFKSAPTQVFSGAYLELLSAVPSAAQTKTNDVFGAIDANLGATFTVARAGSYLMFFEFAVEVLNNGADADYALLFDAGLATEQLVAPAHWVVAAPVWSRESAHKQTLVTLAAGEHTIQVMWKKRGPGTLHTDANDRYYLAGLLVSEAA